jgi:hypothetical protein
MSKRSLTLLNDAGDQVITWEESSDAEMERIIEKKMAQGFTFYIIEPRAWGLFPPKRTELKNFGDALKHRALSIKDADFAAFVGEDKGKVVTAPTAPVKTVRRGKSAKEVAQSESVGVQPRRGG